MTVLFFCVILHRILEDQQITVRILKRFKINQLAKLLLVLPLVVTGCGSSDKAPDAKEEAALMSVRDTVEYVASDSVFSETKLLAQQGAVLERARDIFSAIRTYQLQNGALVMTDLLDKAFCSKAWNELLLAVHRKEYESGTLFFEIDYWTMTRDPGYVTFDEFEVTKMAYDGERMMASVDFTVYEMYTYCPARIDMVYEDGRWVIDNFYDKKFMVDVRSSMQQYIATNFI